MRPYRSPDPLLDVARDPILALDETSDERFDRSAFARQALELVRPERTTVAIYEGAARMRVESGRHWGAPGSKRWAMLAIPPKASRRAIALAVAQLVCDGPAVGTSAAQPSRPYVLDLLLGHGEALGEEEQRERASRLG
jgi:hypothetical protein